MNTHTSRNSFIGVASATIFVLTFLFSGCRPTERFELRVAINPWPGSEFLYLAKEKGFFAEEGVHVRMVEYSSLGDCRVAFENGEVDAMTGTLIEVIQARENSKRSPQVAVVTDYSNGADMILGPSGMTSLADLKGRRVGLELGSLGVFMLARSLEIAGLKLSDLQMIACAPEEMPAAIDGGKVDAVVTYPPTSMRIEAGGRMRRLFSSADIPGEVVDVLAVDAPWIQRDPALPVRLARAMQRALDFAQAHPKDAYAIMGQREGLSAEEFAKALQGVQLVDAAGQRAFLGPGGSLQGSLRDMERILRETGQLHGIQPTASPLPPTGPVVGKIERP
jgi:NitT/TauT family transport system substrate-binding protein